jgi:hypothetical protein
LDNAVEDYNLLMAGKESMLAERNDLCHHAEDLESKLAKVRAAAAVDVAALETKIMSTEVHNVDVAAAGEKHLKDFESEHVEDLVGLCKLYIRNINHIRGLCSPMPEGVPSTMVYIRWLSTEVIGILETFVGVNENFISAMVEGTLVMAGDSVDVAALQIMAVDSGADILPAGWDVRKATRVVSMKWRRSFSYDYVLAAIQAKFCEVNARVQLILL